MKKICICSFISILMFCSVAVAGVTQIGKDLTCINRLGPRDDIIKVLRIDDPQNPFISIYLTQIKAGEIFAFADPSNTAIACRLTGRIPVDGNGNQIVDKSFNKDISSFRKSIGTKVMKIARMYDPQKNVLVYVVYTTKLLDGSLKHSLSVVPLGNPLTP